MGFIRELPSAFWLVVFTPLFYRAECRRIGTVEYDVDYDERTTPVKRTEFNDWDSPEWHAGTCINLPGSNIYSDVLTEIWYDPSNVNPNFPYFVQGVRVWTGPDCEGFADDFLRIEKNEPFRIRTNMLQGSDSGDDDGFGEDGDDEDDEAPGNVFGRYDLGDHDTVGGTPASGTEMEVENDSGIPFLFENTPFTQPPSRRPEVMGDYAGMEGFIFDANHFQEFTNTVPNYRSDIQIEDDQNLMDWRGDVYVPSPGGNGDGFPSDIGSSGSYDVPAAARRGEAADTVYISTDGQPNPDANGIYHYKFWTDDDWNGEDWDSPLSIKIVTDYDHRYRL
ncbi:hypothetical protein TWF696_003947 [Orbilia brochopaga]|uniref:Uncharacterized protein n=1 Tax=Orbilia brochopaga TaxID=3140254 RepID=A0AAV9V7P0_9PEZI